MLDFAYRNISLNIKQLIRVLCCDLQVAIHEGLAKVQDDILEAIANFTDNFHITVTMLSVPQMCALMDHLHARHASSHFLLAAVRHGTTLMRTESFLENGPAKLLQSFFNRLPDHQINIERDSTHPTDLKMEVNHFSRVLQTHLVDVTSNPTLMLDFNCGVEGILTNNLTKEVKVRYLPHQGNIAEDPEDDIEMPTAAPGPSTCQPTTHGGLSKTPAPPADQQQFSCQPIGRLEALMLNENMALIPIKVGMEEALTHFDAHASQDEASYDGNVSDAEEDDIEVIPDEVDDTQVKSLKPVGAISAADKEVQKANKSGGSQTSKSADKNPTHQHSNKASSETWDGAVCYN